MNPARISIVTLGVDNIERAREFYEALGWEDCSESQESIKFLQGNNVVPGLYGREDLAKDASAAPDRAGFSGIALSVNLETGQAVDTFYKHAIDAGSHPQKPPEKAFWGGYSGYFRDLDGHYWQIAHNPYFTLDENGNLKLGADK